MVNKMVECPWCGTHTHSFKKANGDYACGRCKRTIREDIDNNIMINKRIRTMQTDAYKKKISDKLLARTQDWPDREKDSLVDPELSWKRLLKGKKYNVTYISANDNPRKCK
jgi:transcription initiation factor TFIIIB Brf1 subunit/transcription initiation factor TFIIB|tara:strand:- start:99 stop:431 length:333 start_codon:yes stop_codon:yes gene_type:complete